MVPLNKINDHKDIGKDIGRQHNKKNAQHGQQTKTRIYLFDPRTHIGS